MSRKRSVDEADFLSGPARLEVTGGTGGRGGFPVAGPLLAVVVVPPGPTVTEVAGFA